MHHFLTNQHLPLAPSVLALSMFLSDISPALSAILTALMIGWYIRMFYKEWKKK